MEDTMTDRESEMKTMSGKETVVDDGAEIISTSDVHLWRYPEFHQMCLKAATRLQKQVGDITTQFCYEYIPESLKIPHLSKKEAKAFNTVSLCARIAWRGRIVAEVHRSLRCSWTDCILAYTHPINRKPANPRNITTSVQLTKYLENAIKNLEKIYEQLTKPLLK
ncbi:hypothetical protein EPN81_02660 [Patescibacteria group bacterium]|nr:MAG: hypothetical protein EPN81_02660 [Patescibacteria group bacterium]